ncbi:LysR substrate-binding domain-containing protein [Microvirga lotononidis]|uniref:Transcriptional regulator n=1 Tax=Microvirga lotononidis TaxID=864069 RepID=I4YZK5_9HYPH|nr:LysR substrate-binding domain-containing protein [Microvirga lotononidis]EIM29397.1 transcriptional regulator [Microvirga lotononidis]WQO27280.1 LysR substrate-binding domain-containing protein [Microvirga lotononidis]
MNFSQLSAFHAIAQHRTFSSAAQALGITQSAVTQNVKSLEDAVGTRLFHRSAAGVELTPGALDLLPHIRRVVLMLDDLDRRIGEGRNLSVGHLSLGLCAPYVAMPVLERFSQQYPGITLDIRLDNSRRLLELVTQHRVDTAIVTLGVPEPGLMCERLVEQKVLVLVHHQHPWWERVRVDVTEVAYEPFILREIGSMTRELFEGALRRHGITIRPRLVLGSREAMKEAVAAGIGLGIVLNQEVGSDPRLRGIEVDGLEASAAEYVVTRPDIAQHGAVREFILAAIGLSGRPMLN